MEKSIFGLADNESHAQRVVDSLISAGVNREFISIILPDSGTKKGTLKHEKHTKAPEGASTGALTGGIIGGSIGLLAGIGALAIPGLGPFIAAGPLMAALAGSAVGGSTGLLIGALIGLGIPEYEARKYQDSLKAGGVLISVHTDTSGEAEKAIKILEKANVKDIASSVEKTSRVY